MEFCVLASGSKGNSTYIRCGQTSILIDAGLSGKEIQRRLALINVEVGDLDAIIVTHEHRDHIRSVPVLSRRGRLHVFANQATFRSAGAELNKVFSYRDFNTGESFEIKDLLVHPFSISHDTADPVGFLVGDGRYSLGYCTDTGMVSRLMSYRLSSCNGLVLESNHDPVILRNGPYPHFLKQRVQSNQGHLANEDAAAFLVTLLHDNLQEVVLAHLSEVNNLPENAYGTAQEALRKARAGQRTAVPRITVASQDRPCELMCLV